MQKKTEYLKITNQLSIRFTVCLYASPFRRLSFSHKKEKYAKKTEYLKRFFVGLFLLTFLSCRKNLLVYNVYISSLSAFLLLTFLSCRKEK